MRERIWLFNITHTNTKHYLLNVPTLLQSQYCNKQWLNSSSNSDYVQPRSYEHNVIQIKNITDYTIFKVVAKITIGTCNTILTIIVW